MGLSHAGLLRRGNTRSRSRLATAKHHEIWLSEAFRRAATAEVAGRRAPGGGARDCLLHGQESLTAVAEAGSWTEACLTLAGVVQPPMRALQLTGSPVCRAEEAMVSARAFRGHFRPDQPGKHPSTGTGFGVPIGCPSDSGCATRSAGPGAAAGQGMRLSSHSPMLALDPPDAARQPTARAERRPGQPKRGESAQSLRAV